MSQNQQFEIGNKVVYPSHGVGEIVNIEDQIIGDRTIRVYVISFLQEKMMLRVPINRAISIGLRSLVTKDSIKSIYNALRDNPKQGNKMWSRRAQEYESKINSGDVISIAEVVRDLYKNVDSERSYSERTIYESALSRLSKEIAILENTTYVNAKENLIELLKEKSLEAS
jgi:CarD family transcriptional regulator